MNGSLNLNIGGVTFQVALPSPAWQTPLQTHYAPFIDAGNPAWHVTLTHDPALTDVKSPWIRHAGPRTHFRVAVYAGWIDLAARRSTVRTPAQERAPSALDRTLSYICVQALPRRYDALLLHGAGMVWDGYGHVFCGPSGAGKTTVARLAAGRGQVLTDENVIVRLRPGGPEVLSTPFWGHSTPPDLVRRVRRCVPLRAIYVLAPSPAFSLTRLSPGESVVALLTTEKVAIERTTSAGAWLAVAEKLIARVPIYRLEFRPTPELWDFLAET